MVFLCFVSIKTIFASKVSQNDHNLLFCSCITMEDNSLMFGACTKWNYCLLKAKKSLEQSVQPYLKDSTCTVSCLDNVSLSSRMIRMIINEQVMFILGEVEHIKRCSA